MDGFVQIPNALTTYYNYFPQFNGNTMQVYAYLKRMSNDEYGYAFPTELQAMEDLVMSDSTFSKHVKTLKKCGLITVKRHKNGSFSNNVYFVHDPITNADEFFRTYPEADEVKRKKAETIAKIKKRKSDEAEAFVEAKENVESNELSSWL